MPQNRQYAGPHVAAELQVDDGAYIAVARNDLTDEQIVELGFALDADDAVARGVPFVVKTITVSDELAAKLDRAHIEVIDEGTGKPTDQLTPMWPNVGGSTGDIVDSPATNPATRPVILEDGIEIASHDADARAYDAAFALEAEERVLAESTEDPAVALRQRLADIAARSAELETAHAAAVDNDDEDAVKAIEAEAERLAAEKDSIEKALNAGKGN